LKSILWVSFKKKLGTGLKAWNWPKEELLREKTRAINGVLKKNARRMGKKFLQQEEPKRN